MTRRGHNDVFIPLSSKTSTCVCIFASAKQLIREKDNEGRNQEVERDRKSEGRKRKLLRTKARERERMRQIGAVVQHAGTAEFCCRTQGWQAGGCAEAILGGTVED